MPFINKSPLNYPTNSESSIRVFEANRAPTTNDYRNFIIGDEWNDTSSTDFWKLVHRTGSSATWRKMVGTSAAVETFIPDTGTSPVVPDASNQLTFTGGTGIGTVGGLNTMTWNVDTDVLMQVTAEDATTCAPVTNNLTITGGSGIDTTAAGSTLTINSTGGGLAYVEVTGATQAMAVNTCYGANRGAGVTFTLPAAATAGEIMEIVGILGNWSLAQNAGQTVHLGAFSSTTGVGGSLTATNAGDCIRLRCIATNTDFRVQSVVGNITIV